MDTAQNTAPAAAGRFKDRRLRGARRPLPTRHHGKAHRTTLLAILHQPRKGGRLYTTVRTGGWGSHVAPRNAGLRGQKWVGRGRFIHKEALGTLTRLWPLGGGLGAWAVATEKKWHLER